MQPPPAPPTSFERHRRLNFPPFYGFKASDEQLLRDFLLRFARGEELATCPIHTIEDVYASTPEDLTSRYGQGTDTEWFFFSGKTFPDAVATANRAIIGGVWVKQGHTKKITVDFLIPGFKRTQTFHATSPDHDAQWIMEEFSIFTEPNYILAKIFALRGKDMPKPESSSIESTSKQTQSRHRPFQPNNTPHIFGTNPFQPRYQTHNQAQQTEAPSHLTQHTQTLPDHTHNQAQQTETPSHLTQHTQTLPDHTHNQAQQTETPFSSYTACPNSSLPNRYSSPYPNSSIPNPFSSPYPNSYPNSSLPNRYSSANRNSSYQTQNHESPSQSPTADETFIYPPDQEFHEWKRDFLPDDSN